RAQGKPTLLSEYTGPGSDFAWWVRGLYGVLKYTVGRPNITLARHTLCASPAVADSMRRLCPKREIIQVLSPLQHDLFRPAQAGEKQAAKAALGLPADRPVVLYAGRVVAHKGADLLLEAADPRWTLVFCGPCDEEMRARLAAK